MGDRVIIRPDVCGGCGLVGGRHAEFCKGDIPQKRNTPNSTPKLSERAVAVMHTYQGIGRDIELLRDFLAARDEKAGIETRIAAVMLSASQLIQELARMQIAALNEGRDL